MIESCSYRGRRIMQTYDFFVSYSSKDKEIIDGLVH